MPEDGFEREIEGLFAQAHAFGDDEQFVDAVTARTARMRRTERLVHGTAAAIGGGVALYELAQPRIWLGLYAWLGRLMAPLADPQLWTAPDPMTWTVILGAGLAAVYLARVLREA